MKVFKKFCSIHCTFVLLFQNDLCPPGFTLIKDLVPRVVLLGGSVSFGRLDLVVGSRSWVMCS